MKTLVKLALPVVMLVSAPAFADQALANKNGCMACHASDKKLVGPSFQDVAKKYVGKKDAAALLTKEVMNGTNLYDSHWKGKVSGVAMPPNAVAIKEPDAKKLVAWILSLK